MWTRRQALVERKEYWNEQHARDSATTTVNGALTFTKSPKLCCMGPTTSVFTGEEIGVMKAVDAGRATIIANG